MMSAKSSKKLLNLQLEVCIKFAFPQRDKIWPSPSRNSFHKKNVFFLGNAYQQDKVNNWTGAVVENCLTVLTKQQKPYKYIVTSMIMQKNGAGLHTASSCYWNNETDGSCTVRWENKTMYCIVSVFGLAL